MGMMINRRRVYGGKKEDTYIQDGLVFWLDGINKGNDHTAWTDLVGGIKFAWNSSVIVQNDHIDTTSMTQTLRGDRNPSFPSSSCTIECVLLSRGTQTMEIAFAGANIGDVAMGYSLYLIWCMGSPVICPAVSFEANRVFSYSCSNSFRFQNNVKLLGGRDNYWDNPNGYIHVGGRRDNERLFKGNIYCIRIYNRQLTEADVAYNYEIDRKRFNF